MYNNILYARLQWKTCCGFVGDAGGVVHCSYVARQDRVVFASSNAIGARKDLNGILLLDSALQAPISKPDDIVRIELPLPEVSVFHTLYCHFADNILPSVIDYVKHLKEERLLKVLCAVCVSQLCKLSY